MQSLMLNVKPDGRAVCSSIGRTFSLSDTPDAPCFLPGDTLLELEPAMAFMGDGDDSDEVSFELETAEASVGSVLAEDPVGLDLKVVLGKRHL